RERSDGEPEDRRGTHRVDVGDGVRRGDRAEEIRVVDDRCEEVDGFDDRLIAAYAQHGRVVVRGVTDEKIPDPLMRGDFGEHSMQVILTQLAGSTARRRERRERGVRATELV